MFVFGEFGCSLPRKGDITGCFVESGVVAGVPACEALGSVLDVVCVCAVVGGSDVRVLDNSSVHSVE